METCRRLRPGLRLLLRLADRVCAAVSAMCDIGARDADLRHAARLVNVFQRQMRVHDDRRNPVLARNLTGRHAPDAGGVTTGRHEARGDAARLRAAPRYGARTRKGTPRAAPAIRGRARCRMHGGAAGSGAPHGNRNAFKDGFHTATARAERRAMSVFITEMSSAVARLERDSRG